jgi:hypothetical protein
MRTRWNTWSNSRRHGVRFNTDECFETARFQALRVRVSCREAHSIYHLSMLFSVVLSYTLVFP